MIKVKINQTGPTKIFVKKCQAFLNRRLLAGGYLGLLDFIRRDFGIHPGGVTHAKVIGKCVGLRKVNSALAWG